MIYRYKCGKVDCEVEYIRESGITFAERFKENMETLSPIHNHDNTIGHDISIDHFGIVGREDQNLGRSTKEAIFLKINAPSLNRNIGKYQLPHVWDEVLVNSGLSKQTYNILTLCGITPGTYMLFLQCHEP